MTAGFSGADLANLVNEAALIGTRRNANQVEARDFTEAIERIVAGLERRNRVLSPAEKKRVAYHEMGHATVALSKGKSELVHKVTIVPRGFGALGYTFSRPTEERYLVESKELENKIAMLLGGRVAETIFFDDISTGAADDLDKASDIARAMVTRYGMSSNIGNVTYDREVNPYLMTGSQLKSQNFSEVTAQLIDKEVKRLLDRAFEVARECLLSKREFIEKAAEELIAHETLEEGPLKNLWDQYANAAGVPMNGKLSPAQSEPVVVNSP